ncbi:MAG TPA: hypothetical protein VN599_08580, partial [Rudaea sp.]|nr:hypothetical protein [Rudaea sp.]
AAIRAERSSHTQAESKGFARSAQRFALALGRTCRASSARENCPPSLPALGALTIIGEFRAPALMDGGLR